MDILTYQVYRGGYLVNGSYHCLPGTRLYVKVEEMIAAGGVPEPEFTQAELDDLAAAAADKALDDAAEITVVGDNALKAFVNARPAGIESYIDNNVTDMASAKVVLKMLAKIVWMLVKDKFK